MKSKLRITLDSLIWALVLLMAYTLAAHAQTTATNNPHLAKKPAQPELNGINPAVTGTGTVGQLPKWTGLNGIGDSVISEDKFGKIGIGTIAPTSKLTVTGMIETTMGGLKFPDGTVQTTAGQSSIFHNATLTGNGTALSPLGIALPLNLSGPAVQSVLTVVNTAHSSASAISATGADADSFSTIGGFGLVSTGGQGLGGSFGGNGVAGIGGDSPLSTGGVGLVGGGGAGSNRGGSGLEAYGGNFFGFGSGGTGSGGFGAIVRGGAGAGAGNKGGDGLYAQSGTGQNGAPDGLAGRFEGGVEVKGNFNVTGGGTKNFKIDHPLDPENKYLYHAAIESSEVLNIYSGNATTDESGEAVITLPDWFEAVNRDFRYQLTVVGTFAQAIVGNKIKGNRFQIKTSAANVEVSWQVTGIRSDAAIRKHPFQVEEDKPQTERGSYLSPEAYDQPAERGIQWAHNPQVVQQLKQQRKENQ